MRNQTPSSTSIAMLAVITSLTAGAVALADGPGAFTSVGNLTEPRWHPVVSLLQDGTVVIVAGWRLAKNGKDDILASKLLEHSGEQVLSYHPDGTVRIWGDRNASDTPEARARYAHPFYRANMGLGSTGSNLGVLAGV
jgi:hypothetical protein